MEVEGNESMKLEGDLTGDGGVIKEILEAGESAAKPGEGDEVSVSYTGMLEDGTVFDSSGARGQPFSFKLGKGSVIKGWDVVVRSMTKGEKARVVLQPSYGYGETGSPPKIPPMSVLKFDLELVSWISVRDVFGDKGVMRTIESEGEGWERPAVLSEVTMRVVVTLLEPGPSKVLYEGDRTFSIGAKKVPASWEKVASDMKKGARMRLTCVDQYVGGPSIDFLPADVEKVEYDLTMKSWLKVEDLSEDKGVIKKILQEGEGWETPNQGASAVLNLKYRVMKNEIPGEVFGEAENFECKVSDGALVDGLDKAVQKMKRGEVAVVYLQPSYAFGGAPNLCPSGVSPNDEIAVDVTLVSFVRAKDSWSMSSDEKLVEAQARKAKGNELFKQGRIKLAMRHYELATGFFEYSTAELGADVRKQVNMLKSSCHLNLAMCFSKEGNHEKVIHHANKALEFDHANVKALFKRGVAFIYMDDYYKAERDLEHAQSIDPQNVDVKRKLQDLHRLMAQQDAKERSLYTGMFAKAKTDA